MKTSRRCTSVEILETRRCLTDIAFSQHLLFELDTGESPLSVDLVDLDGDQDLDIVASITRPFNGPGSRLVWFKNDGRGTFGEEINIASERIVSIAFGDIDSDSDLDLIATGENTGGLSWFPNLDGKGEFGPRNPIPVNMPGALAVAVGDIDGDEDLDVMSAYGGWQLDGRRRGTGFAWYRNKDGNGDFEEVQLDMTQGIGPVELTDLDGDGDLDAILGSGTLDNTDGAGGFTFSRGSFESPIHSVVAGDLNGNGREEVLISNNYFDFSRLDLGNAITTGVIFNDLGLHDLDNDEDLDLVTAAYVGVGLTFSGGVQWFENTNAFATTTDAINLTDNKTTSVAAGDVDGDGDGDADIIAAAFSDGKIWWYESDLADATTVRLDGDANADGEVNFGDFLTLASNFGKDADAVWGDGDFDENGKVDFGDFLILATNFGATKGLSQV